jgi:[ribosomal protein S5]-alanine N-acetyltransferase
MNSQIDLSFFNSFPELETERLNLRMYLASDALELFRIRSDEETMKYMDSPLHLTIDDSRLMIEDIGNAYQYETGINWVIESKFNGKMLGYVGFWRIMPEHVRGEIGYALNRKYWGKGYMKEAITAVLHFGFKHLCLHSVEANVNPGNKASTGLLLNLGFRKEGHMKENYFVNGRFVDTIIFSLLEQDFDL